MVRTPEEVLRREFRYVINSASWSSAHAASGASLIAKTGQCRDGATTPDGSRHREQIPTVSVTCSARSPVKVGRGIMGKKLRPTHAGRRGYGGSHEILTTVLHVTELNPFTSSARVTLFAETRMTHGRLHH